MPNSEDFEDFHILDDQELLAIQEDYRRQKLKENLIGPIISTLAHLLLLIVAATLFKGEIIKKNETVEISPVHEEVPQEEPPPPPPPPEIPPPEPQEIISHDPQVTSDAVPDAADLVGAIDDVSDEPPSTDDNAEADLVNDIKPSASNIVSSKMFGGRSSAGRAGALKSYGGSVAAQDALHKALNWLAKVQNPDGSWGIDRFIESMTGYALLVFLAHGETPKSKNFGNTVSRAIKYLVESPMRKGDVYSNGIAAYALAEAYAMTGIYSIEEPLSKRIKVITDGQMNVGGFNYRYQPDGRSDMSCSSWNIQALKAAKSTGLDFPGINDTIYKAIDFLHDQGKAGKDFPYGDPEPKKSNHGLRAAGTLCLQLLGATNNDSDRHMDYLQAHALPLMNWDKPEAKDAFYRWYYITFAMFQKGGQHWKAWNAKFQNVLKNNQNPAGYWDHPNEKAGYHGNKFEFDQYQNRIYSTCLASLMLTVYYRYLPSTSKKGNVKVAGKTPQQKKAKKDEAMGEENDIDIF
jgi:hypothetical protein